MRRVRFNCHVLGVPNGGGPTHSYVVGEVVDLPDEEYELLEGRRLRNGRRWIEPTRSELRRLEPTASKAKKRTRRAGRRKASVESRTCPICLVVFRYPSELKRHRPRCSPGGDYICGECGAGFDTPQALGGHRKGHGSGTKTDPVTGRKLERWNYDDSANP